jgi:hypothetical protein
MNALFSHTPSEKFLRSKLLLNLGPKTTDDTAVKLPMFNQKDGTCGKRWGEYPTMNSRSEDRL